MWLSFIWFYFYFKFYLIIYCNVGRLTSTDLPYSMAKSETVPLSPRVAVHGRSLRTSRAFRWAAPQAHRQWTRWGRASPISRSRWIGDALVVFVFYGCVVVPRALALLCTFSCSHKTKNKGTLVLASDRLSLETIGRLCSGIGGRQLGVGPSLK